MPVVIHSMASSYRKNDMNYKARDVEVLDGVALRSAIREALLIQTATTYSSISAGHDDTEQFHVGVNNVVFNGSVVAVHPVPFSDNLIGATVYIGVKIPVGFIADEYLPQGYNPQERLMFSIQISGETDSFKGYTSIPFDTTLRVRS